MLRDEGALTNVSHVHNESRSNIIIILYIAIGTLDGSTVANLNGIVWSTPGLLQRTVVSLAAIVLNVRKM